MACSVKRTPIGQVPLSPEQFVLDRLLADRDMLVRSGEKLAMELLEDRKDLLRKSGELERISERIEAIEKAVNELAATFILTVEDD